MSSSEFLESFAQPDLECVCVYSMYSSQSKVNTECLPWSLFTSFFGGVCHSTWSSPIQVAWLANDLRPVLRVQGCATWFLHGSSCWQAKSFAYWAISPALRSLCTTQVPVPQRHFLYLLSTALLTHFVPVIAKVSSPLEVAGILYVCVGCCLLPFLSCLYISRI